MPLAMDKFTRPDIAWLKPGAQAFRIFDEILSTPVNFSTFNFQLIFQLLFQKRVKKKEKKYNQNYIFLEYFECCDVWKVLVIMCTVFPMSFATFTKMF